MVHITIVSEFCSTEKTFSDAIELGDLCNKLYPITGIEVNDMRFVLKFADGSEQVISNPMVAAHKQPFLAEKSVRELTVEDTNADSIVNELKNTDSGSSSFELTEEEYAKKNDSVLRWKKQQKLGRFNSEYKAKMDKDRRLQEQKLNSLEINQRCSVKSADQPERRGWLRFIGKIATINEEQIWCGIEFDEPLGKNNGTVKGHVYFGPVKDKYGAFVKPSAVETGSQFTPFELEDSDDDEL
ncbi:hypothetical protein KAFR_0F00620 [Kazachstania africana CBS 2517]|uniref:CAP-Gly domain-containing protein n=1 Tax=Kazachstania africana (strain ATCC 22294 / BCRC 22015 / CBS 2517 / CECT 1963 / NBRC 1671 / NRRL Y-8276) TaxID=1071382 RepID=H2AWA9_KAZAF|nr:hypothetical protein KAFR_0F00620 [Kazachstania africana CBS 2517]CCF58659.1 hypothetical protein KAFR_0F00620 [Kazachstania africana CBS 2517]